MFHQIFFHQFLKPMKGRSSPTCRFPRGLIIAMHRQRVIYHFVDTGGHNNLSVASSNKVQDNYTPRTNCVPTWNNRDPFFTPPNTHLVVPSTHWEEEERERNCSGGAFIVRRCMKSKSTHKHDFCWNRETRVMFKLPPMDKQVQVSLSLSQSQVQSGN